ncbi:MAG: helix-turn-helix transcriptional regulator [Candidatus Gastranaerophilales bacterium]|nr:helix-turn-helix transcriptional regulator [Candidatus Gastranaerophilales bacterium]
MQYDKLGLYIKNKRLKAGKSLNGFALENGIEPAVLSRIENLKQGIKLDALFKIAKGFGQSPAEFLLTFETK